VCVCVSASVCVCVCVQSLHMLVHRKRDRMWTSMHACMHVIGSRGSMWRAAAVTTSSARAQQQRLH